LREIEADHRFKWRVRVGSAIAGTLAFGFLLWHDWQTACAVTVMLWAQGVAWLTVKGLME
jgi:hypothetical protein